MTNLGTAAIHRSVAGDRAVVAIVPDETTRAGCLHATSILPRGPEREIVRERKRSYELNGRESAALSIARTSDSISTQRRSENRQVMTRS